MTFPWRPGRTAVAAVAAALVLVSCTPAEDEARSGADPSAAATPPTVPPSGASTGGSTGASAGPGTGTLPAAARPPRTGACYDLDFEQATAPTNDASSVPCSEPHTTRTFHVGRLETVVDGHLLAVDSRVAQEQVRTVCPRRLDRYTGGSPRDRRLSRLRAVWFSPTIEQSDQGATWFRCDVVALGRNGNLEPLPPRLGGILDRPGGLDQVGLCGTTNPGARGFQRVMCGRPHAWRAVATIDLAGSGDYPGVAAVRRAGEDRCRDLVRRASGSADRFRYGWEWPTREQWRAGQRYGFCWAPD